MTTVDIQHQVKLVEGKFSAIEALDLVNALIREKINFHKLHRLSVCEGNENSDTSYDDGRVAQLYRDREQFVEFFQEVKASGKNLRIRGTLEIEVVD